MSVHRLWIPHWRPTALNRILYSTVRARIALKRADAEIVRGYALLTGTPAATGPRRVSLEITLHGRQREADVDAYWKIVLDALVSAKLLLGDDIRSARLGEVSYRRGGDWGTAIVLEELEP
jgi:Holliday junction resolvase RusA-like endonuclease